MTISDYKNKIPLKKLRKSLDILWSQLIKLRDRRCVRCSKSDRLNSAHIFSRSQMSVRWEVDNGITLCGGCHIFWAHLNPIEFSRFIEKRIGKERLETLARKSKTLIKVDRFFLETKTKELQNLVIKSFSH